MSSSNLSGIPSSVWILDSGASHHMSPYMSSFTSMSPRTPVSVLSANSSSMTVEGVGSIVNPYITLTDVYYIPSLALNLASVSQLCKSGCWVFFSDDFCCVQEIMSKKVIGIGHRVGDLYVQQQLHVAKVATSSVDLSSFRLSPSSFHLVSSGVLGSLKTENISDCCGCKLGKFSTLPFSNSNSQSFAPFDIVHYDVWGPAPVPTKSGATYYVSFIDDYTRYTWVYLLRRKSEFVEIYNEFCALVKTHIRL